MRLALAVLGFVVGAGLAIGAETILLLAISAASDREFLPRGLGWLAIPIMAGIAGARFAPIIPALIVVHAPQLASALKGSMHRRFMLVGSGGWILVLVAYWVLAKPYGYRMHSGDWVNFIELLVVPPALFVVLYLAALWARSGD